MNVFVSGFSSNNVLRITADGVKTEIMDSTGDDSGNALTQPLGIATDRAGDVFVAGYGSNNVFKARSDVVFWDTFESGDLTSWSGVEQR